jgi:hypothetical protein
MARKLHHFGAFLKREWREADMVWGRLDGAERPDHDATCPATP